MLGFRFLALGAVVFASAFWGSVMPSAALTGGELAEYCAGYPTGGRPALCELYVSSGRDFVNSDDRMENPRGKLCIPTDTSIGELIKVVNDWLDSHPELHAKSGYDATYGGFAKAYRCR